MANSLRLRKLIARINFLEDNILPKAKINGNYSKIEVDLIKSFVLLVHAEFEAYFEDKAKDKAQKSYNDWRTSRKKSACLKAILAFAGNEVSYNNTSKLNKNSIEFRMNRAVAHYLELINKNNGVKEDNLLKILLPLGLELNELDETWLSVMDSFGSTRGNIAHNAVGVHSPIDRSSELDRIKNQILPEIMRLDHRIERLI
jgi:hypothetical protein